MRRSLLMMIAGTLVGGGVTLAQRGEHGKAGIKALSRNDIIERIDGKNAMATTVELTLGPGESSAPHRHPGPAFGYVVEGEYDWAIDENSARTFKAGDTFYEPTGCLHLVSKNPSKTDKTRILAVVLVPADVKDIVIPEKVKQ